MAGDDVRHYIGLGGYDATDDNKFVDAVGSNTTKSRTGVTGSRGASITVSSSNNSVLIVAEPAVFPTLVEAAIWSN